MDGRQSLTERLFGHKQVSQIGSGIVLTNITPTLFFNWSEIIFKFFIGNMDFLIKIRRL